MAELEAEVFLTGIWKNYAELEEELSMPELLATLEASRKVAESTHKIMAAVQGVEWPDSPSASGSSFEDIERRAALRARGLDPDSEDVVNTYGRDDGIEYETL